MKHPTRREVSRVFGKLLRAVRTDAGLSQEDLAADAEVDRTYPSLLERGLRNPSLYEVLKLATALKIRTGLLVDAVESRLRGES